MSLRAALTVMALPWPLGLMGRSVIAGAGAAVGTARLS
jgi:hypothetical protein